MPSETSEPSPAAARADLGKDEAAFVSAIRENRTSGTAATATLTTDDRVLARITDGIYRQPSSALRELISNAYDADATQVVIDTDAPRFRQIRIRDNGHGMDEDALGRMIYHIGGSSKRTTVGAKVGTTDAKDPSRSPNGRKLIGKIGIGLFSVSQLTSHFQIITKVAGADHRLFADVVLRTYSESDEPSDGTFESGTVKVVSVPAEDLASHGTEIILLNVRPKAKDILRSKDRWENIFEQENLPAGERDPGAVAPPWHIGFAETSSLDGEEDVSFRVPPCLPWNLDDPPQVRFEKLYQGVADQVGSTTERPDLAKTLDTYLGTIWALSLSAPIGYMGKHPFDLGADDNLLVFKLSNIGRGRADPVTLPPGQTVRQALGLKAGAEDPAGGFTVYIDQIELRRPISYQYWAAKKQGVSQPMLFVGSYKPDLSKVSKNIRGGNIAFEGYLFWNSRIIPKENNGILIRINGSSGALFDDTFMKYQVSEQTRLRQITSEIFVSEGLDAALNIDRESFNFAHSHYQIVSNWVHRALRQLANTHKGIGDDIRAGQKHIDRIAATDKLGRFAATTWARARSDHDESPPEVELVATPIEAAALRRTGVLALDMSQLPRLPALSARNAKDEGERRVQITKALATVLDGFGLLQDMPYARQHELIGALLAVFFEDAQNE